MPKGSETSIIKHKSANIKLTKGPANEIVPFLLIPTGPEIITAPGAANTNPKKLITNANISILLKDLNSA